MVAPYLGFNCQSCGAIEGLAEESGCHGPATVGRHEIGPYSSDRCPLALMRDSPQHMAWLWHAHQTWGLRRSTPYTRSPAILVDAWDEISRCRNQLKEWYYEQSKNPEEPATDEALRAAPRRTTAMRQKPEA